MASAEVCLSPFLRGLEVDYLRLVETNVRLKENIMQYSGKMVANIIHKKTSMQANKTLRQSLMQWQCGPGSSCDPHGEMEGTVADMENSIDVPDLCSDPGRQDYIDIWRAILLSLGKGDLDSRFWEFISEMVLGNTEVLDAAKWVNEELAQMLDAPNDDKISAAPSSMASRGTDNGAIRAVSNASDATRTSRMQSQPKEFMTEEAARTLDAWVELQHTNENESFNANCAKPRSTAARGQAAPKVWHQRLKPLAPQDRQPDEAPLGLEHWYHSMNSTTASSSQGGDPAWCGSPFSQPCHNEPQLPLLNELNGAEEEVQSGLSNETVSQISDDMPIGTAAFGKEDRTVIIKNFPKGYTTTQVLGMWPPKGSYNLLHMPYHAKQRRTVGYAFINFVSQKALLEFTEQWQGAVLTRRGVAHYLQIRRASVQGFHTTLRHIKAARQEAHFRGGLHTPVIIWANGTFADSKEVAAHFHMAEVAEQMQQENEGASEPILAATIAAGFQ